MYYRKITMLLLRSYYNYNLNKKGLYNGKKYVRLIDNNKANMLLDSIIKAGEPVMISRFGNIEFKSLFSKDSFHELCNNAGFFPENEKLLNKFRYIYKESYRNIDVFALWIYKYNGIGHWKRKKKVISEMKNLKALITLQSLNPYDNIWYKSLEGKRVLVVHPFKESIEYQYSRKDLLKIIPRFKSLEIVKAVQTIADEKDDRFHDWFEALDYMKSEIKKREFDICLIGCGAYGMPLASYVKNIGKQAFHIGGALQLLFGIKGRRWEIEYGYKFDDNWIYPLDCDRPKSASKVENSCYW